MKVQCEYDNIQRGAKVCGMVRVAILKYPKTVGNDRKCVLKGFSNAEHCSTRDITNLRKLFKAVAGCAKKISAESKARRNAKERKRKLKERAARKLNTEFLNLMHQPVVLCTAKGGLV